MTYFSMPPFVAKDALELPSINGHTMECHCRHLPRLDDDNYDLTTTVVYKWRLSFCNAPQFFPPMSLPPAHKDISVHPAHASVVDPLNQAEANHDIDRKVSIDLGH